jgi:2-oxoglutarate ferredoxin oxidoreductase subunit alpha
VLQTPVIILTDLDLGMNDHTSKPFKWDDKRKYKRGKVLNAKQLDEIGRFGRYLDVDGDGIPYRTYPGTHPTKGAFFTRGTSRDEYANYTEDGEIYKRNMDRLMVKWETAKSIVPEPEFSQGKNSSDYGMIFFGTSSDSAFEAMDLMKETGLQIDAMRIRSFPFNHIVHDFITSHKRVFVIEQNRDGQMRGMLILELGIHPEKLIPILNYDGMPITAHTILTLITQNLTATKSK